MLSLSANQAWQARNELNQKAARVGGSFHSLPVCLLTMRKQRPVRLQEESVIGIQGRSQFSGPLLADGALAVFHFRDMALGDTGQFGQLGLGKVFAITVTAQGDGPFRLAGEMLGVKLLGRDPVIPPKIKCVQK
ncbi:MAG: hypothetical protein U5J62_06700 [Desulfurivibrio sp.]|nr:hypothetical protein [Desulfurivibrio sp.]